MRATRWLAAPGVLLLAILGLLLALHGPERAGIAVSSKKFKTTRCRAETLAPERPHPGGSWRYQDWKAPAQSVIELARLEPRIEGQDPGDKGTIRSFTRDEIATWERSVNDGQVQLSSPRLGVQGATRVEVLVVPGGLRRFAVIPSPKGEIDARERRTRALEFTLDHTDEPRKPVRVSGAIDTVLAGNWGDEKMREVELVRLGLSWPEDVDPLFEQVTLLGPGSEYADAPAGHREAEIDGIIHPAWFAHAGTQVGFDIDIPADTVLRFYDGAIGSSTIRTLRILEGDTAQVLYTGSGSGGWEHREVSLAAFGGRRVRLEFIVEGEGVGFLGAGRLLSGDPGPAPNIIVYLVDTLRADHLGAYGSPIADVSPRIDAMAAQGATFGLAISSSPWTKPAIPTLLSSRFPTTHGVGSVAYTDLLPETVPMLQERFGEAGWRTGSFSSSPLGSTLSGLERGFHTALPPHHWRGRLGRLGHVSATQLHEALLRWVSEEPQQPFFAYVQTLEVHGWRRAPYENPPGDMASYDYAVKDADTRLGELIDDLRARGLASNTLIVVLSDHGESFGDHGVKDHGSSLYQSQVHIPLIFWADEAIPPITVNDPVSIADVAPTLLDLFDLQNLPDADGRSLVPYFDGRAEEPIHAQVPAARIRYLWLPDAPRIFAVIRHDGEKLIRYPKRHHAFDLYEDPCEARSVGHASVAAVEGLDGWLAEEARDAEVFRDAHGVSTGAVDAEHVEQLRDLGYLE